MRVERGQPRRAEQLDQVHERGQHHGAGQRRKQALGVDDPAHPGVDAGLRRFGDGQRRTVTEGGEVLHVERADAERHHAQHKLDQARVPEHEEHVQPRGHEGEVDDTAHSDEGAADRQHLAAVAQVHQQRKHE